MNNIFICLILLLFQVQSVAQVLLDPKLYSLRNSEPREWSEFPEKALSKELLVNFEVDRNEIPKTLSLRQSDVKLDWIIELNGTLLNSLYVDEKDLIAYHTLERSAIKIGTNTLRIYSTESIADDIRVGEVRLYTKELFEIFMETTLDLEVVDENENLIPSHITIINEHRVLQSFATNKGLYAARPGHIYTATGKIKLSLPAGHYKVFAGRGFEYSVDSVFIELGAGDSIQRKLRVRREVDTRGWISSDPHVHTFTHSQHGDATDRERVITLAGENIELPVITDHNQHIDLQAAAKRCEVAQYLTLVTGNEVTSKVGHFNVFPIDSSESVISSTPPHWAGLQTNIAKYKHHPMVIILNHARDIHNGFRPHDPARFLGIAGQRLDDEPTFANAMEVINSGSQQSDWMQLFYDWMHMLNAGFQITPVGSSDSHDVSRFIVGQGRTYIKVDDDEPGSIDVNATVKNFLEGNVMVSCGLLTSIKVNNQFGPGEMSTPGDHVTVDVQVSGPAWATAERLVLYLNGEKFKEERIDNQNGAGVKWRRQWTIPKMKHDFHLVAIADGPGDKVIFWPLAKPFQPTSPEWKPRVLGASGAVWVDADGNGRRESSNDYAKKIIAQSANKIDAIMAALDNYDESVAIQVAAILHLNKGDLASKKIQNALKKASLKTQSGFDRVLREIRMLNTQ